jgi:hypothetical protein
LLCCVHPLLTRMMPSMCACGWSKSHTFTWAFCGRRSGGGDEQRASRGVRNTRTHQLQVSKKNVNGLRLRLLQSNLGGHAVANSRVKQNVRVDAVVEYGLREGWTAGVFAAGRNNAGEAAAATAEARRVEWGGSARMEVHKIAIAMAIPGYNIFFFLS